MGCFSNFIFPTPMNPWCCCCCSGRIFGTAGFAFPVPSGSLLPHSHFQGLDSIPGGSLRPILLCDITRRLLHPPGADLGCLSGLWDGDKIFLVGSKSECGICAGSGFRVREGSAALLEGNYEHKAITALPSQGNLPKLSACPSESQIN